MFNKHFISGVQIMRVVKLKLAVLSLMTGTILSVGLLKTSEFPVKAVELQADVATTEYLKQPINVKGGDQTIMMALRNMNLQDLLKILASQAGFNILLDESVEGNISVDFNNVTINQALETVKDYANLVYMQDDKTLVVASKESPLSKNINQQVSQMIPIKYVNAKLITEILNNTVFTADSSSAAAASGASNKKASTEYRTNSVLIVGTDNDIRLAEEIIKNLDIPRKSKTFKINHASVIEVTQILQATVFNDGVAPFNASSAGAATPGGIQAKSTLVSVDTEGFQEGSGTSNQVQGASGSAGSGQQQTFTLRNTQMTTKELNISPEGPIIVPDSRANTITIMGTVEQIALAESIIPNLDQKVPQVAIESSLVELTESSLRQLNAIWGHTAGNWATGFNNSQIAGTTIRALQPAIQPLANASVYSPGSVSPTTLTNYYGKIENIIGLPTVNAVAPLSGNGSAAAYSSVPIGFDSVRNFIYQLNMLLSRNKAKLLANPTVIALHNTESVISITEEIIRRSTTTRDSTGFQQTTVEIGEAGILLNILPKVTGDGFVTLRIRPSISNVYEVTRDASGNIVTLLRRKDFAVQEVRLANAQTLALGGLIQEASSKDFSGYPGISNMPILGPLFRTNARNQDRVEVLMLITPRILEDDKPVILSSFNQKPVVDIKTNAKNIVNPAPADSAKNVSSLDTEKLVVPANKPEITPVKVETATNSYKLDSVAKELEQQDIKIDQKQYDKRKINQIMDEYLPKGSKN